MCLNSVTGLATDQTVDKVRFENDTLPTVPIKYKNTTISIKHTTHKWVHLSVCRPYIVFGICKTRDFW